MRNNVLPHGRSRNLKQTDWQVNPLSTPLDGDSNLFLGFAALFYINYIVFTKSCVNSLITAGLICLVVGCLAAVRQWHPTLAYTL